MIVEMVTHLSEGQTRAAMSLQLNRMLIVVTDAYIKAIKLNPKLAGAHNKLGVTPRMTPSVFRS